VEESGLTQSQKQKNKLICDAGLNSSRQAQADVGSIEPEKMGSEAQSGILVAD
jgi:hypothetical protein